MILGTSALPRFQIPGARADHQTPERSRQEASIVDMRKKQKSDSQHAGDGLTFGHITEVNYQGSSRRLLSSG